MLSVSFLLLILAILAAPSMMQAQSGGIKVFVQLGDIRGESADRDHKDWIDAAACSDGFIMPLITRPGAASGEPEVSPVRILKAVDAASPKIREAALMGTHIPEVTIEFTRAGGDSRFKYLEIKLKEVLVTEVSMTTQVSDVSQELVALDYGSVEMTYTLQKPDGTAGGTIRFKWTRTTPVE
jgi:type VI secretion system secreted protein Hcp